MAINLNSRAMKKFITPGLLFVFLCAFANSQNTIVLTFTGVNNNQHVPLSKIQITNLTLGVDTMLFAPDTVLVLGDENSIFGNKIKSENTFHISQNYPNPFTDQTSVNIFLPQKTEVVFSLINLLGLQLIEHRGVFDAGNHVFSITGANELCYIFSATVNGETRSIKMFHKRDNSDSKPQILYKGKVSPTNFQKSYKLSSGFKYNIGDQLKYIGFYGTSLSFIEDSPTTSQTYTFEFTGTIGVPCPGTPTVVYQGLTYNTVLIGDQCWLKENLNVGVKSGGSPSSNNGVIEKYCYNNNSSNCIFFGGLYEWDEMMQYVTLPGTQGICPQDWHIPSDEEWKILEGTVDSQYPVGDPEWDVSGEYRGFDVGFKLKSEHQWEDNGNGDNSFGFSALPGGYCYNWGAYCFSAYKLGWFWTSSTYGSDNRAWKRGLWYEYDNMIRSDGHWSRAYSVRCIKD